MAQCLSPVYVQSPKGRLFVPCGKCNFCLSRRRNDWTFRLRNETKYSKTAYFLTLTYDEDHYPDDGKLKKKHLQDFFKRLRKKQGTYIKSEEKTQQMALKWPNIKYFAVGEYGTQTQRAHYHAIMFNICPRVTEDLLKLWGHGHIVCVPSNAATIHYTTKYVINNANTELKGFALISNGLGAAYEVNAQYHRKSENNFVMNDGIPMAMPRYYRDKYFSKHQRQVIAVKTQRRVDAKYKEDIQHISEHHKYPDSYYRESQVFAHDKIKSKINKNNKF